MRGCVSAGMIAAVSTFGLMDSFDAVYGSSAGSLVGAYAIAGQVRSAVIFATISVVCLCYAWCSCDRPQNSVWCSKNVCELGIEDACAIRFLCVERCSSCVL